MKISVIVPNLSGEIYLQDCEASLAAQNAQRVGMKGPGDPELEIIIEEDDKNSPKGVAAMRNLGLEAASGDFVFFLDSDDYLSDNALRMLAKEARKNPDRPVGLTFKKTRYKRDGQLAEEAGNRGDAGQEKEAGTLENAGQEKEAGNRENAGQEKEAGNRGNAGQEKEAGNRENAGQEKEAGPRGDDGQEKEAGMQKSAGVGKETAGDNRRKDGEISGMRGMESVLGILIPAGYVKGKDALRFREDLKYYCDIPFMAGLIARAGEIYCIPEYPDALGNYTSAGFEESGSVSDRGSVPGKGSVRDNRNVFGDSNVPGKGNVSNSGSVPGDSNVRGERTAYPCVYYKRSRNDAIRYPALDQLKDKNRYAVFAEACRYAQEEILGLIAKDPKLAGLMENKQADVRNTGKQSTSEPQQGGIGDDKARILADADAIGKVIYARMSLWGHICDFIYNKMTRGKHPEGLEWNDDVLRDVAGAIRQVHQSYIKNSCKGVQKSIMLRLSKGRTKAAQRLAKLYVMNRKKKGLFGSLSQWKWNIYKRIFRKLPVKKNLFLFESFLGKSYGDSCRAIYEYMISRDGDGQAWTVVEKQENKQALTAAEKQENKQAWTEVEKRENKQAWTEVEKQENKQAWTEVEKQKNNQVGTASEKRGGRKIEYVWVIDNKDAQIPGKHKECKPLSLKYFYYVARCAAWVSNMRQPAWYEKREGVRFLETWHGTPLKKLVFDMDDVHSASPEYKMTFYKQSRIWDWLVSDNRFSTDAFESAFLFPREKILELGYPRNDLLYGEDRDERAARIRRKLGIPEGKKVVLYAPTWRDDDYYGPGQYKFELPLDLDLMEKLKDEYFFILRTHYFIADHLQLDDSKKQFVMDCSRYNDIGELYLISDVLITDYSSVFFDYANLRRPILFYVYDFEKYRDTLRGFYFDMESGVPGPLLYTSEEVLEALKDIESVEKKFADKYREFTQKFCSLDDGHAAERVVKAVFEEFR